MTDAQEQTGLPEEPIGFMDWLLRNGGPSDYDYVKALRSFAEGLQETHRIQLAAISVASLTNTRESFDKQRLERASPYWTPAYEDVLQAVTREMNERQRAEAALALARKDAERLAGALQPFANFACDPLNSCGTPPCFNCVARAAIDAALDRGRE